MSEISEEEGLSRHFGRGRGREGEREREREREKEGGERVVSVLPLHCDKKVGRSEEREGEREKWEKRDLPLPPPNMSLDFHDNLPPKSK